MPDTFHNPVYPAYFADPFCFLYEGTYYAIGTGKDEADACPRTGNVVPMIKSPDLHHWQQVGPPSHILQQHPDEKGGYFWAPEIVHEGGGGRFHMYYAPGGRRPGLQFHLRCATSDSPEGPYTDVGRPLTDLSKNPFCIDAHAFRDADGTWYMFYATDFLDISPPHHRGTGLVVDRMTSMTSLENSPRTVMCAKHPWQLFQRNRDMHGKIADWYTLEGPTVLRRNGRYYLFYSGGNFQNDTYGVDYLIADHPLGPWREPHPDRTRFGPQLVRTIPSRIIGPGHNSIVTGKDGNDYFIYHAWNHAMTERQLWIDPLLWTPEGPRIKRFASYIEENTCTHL